VLVAAFAVQTGLQFSMRYALMAILFPLKTPYGADADTSAMTSPASPPTRLLGRLEIHDRK
jgi:hypothetical protein